MPQRNPKKGVQVYVLTLAVACLAWATVTPVYAETVAMMSELEWITMSISLLGGLALFLYGMEQMAEALKTVAGQRMKDILSRLTTNRISAAATGAFVTAIIQSSSVTTVLVVGFISAGMMSLSQSIGIIMGANIGTTITAQIVAFKITKTAMLLITIGFSMLFFGKSDKLKSYGGMTMGLGLIFFGMSVMSDAMDPLRDYQPFVDVMIKMENPFIAIVVAALFTALVQSSSATTGIVVVMASQGFITLPAGIALALGANIGTCVTALLAAIGKPREALRASVIHVLFNIAGVTLWIGFIAQLAELAIWMSPAYTDLAGLDKLAKETPRQIANANTAFNVMNTLIFLPFTTLISQLTVKLIPDKPVIEKEIVRTQFLDKELLNTPALALDRVRKEIGHMGDIVTAMLCGIQPAIQQRRREHIEDIEKRDDQVDVLHERILSYLGSVQKTTLS